jgi:dipeptidyl aminopeptidase/acylaminoacyl peptidase
VQPSLVQVPPAALRALGALSTATVVVDCDSYYKYSALYHLEGMPRLCILHGVDDELVPFTQSVMLDEELTRLGMVHEFYSYEGLQHYFSTSADNATTQQMFRDSLDCLRRSLSVD